MYVCMYVSKYVCVLVLTYVRICACVCACVRAHTHALPHVCIYVHNSNARIARLYTKHTYEWFIPKRIKPCVIKKLMFVNIHVIPPPLRPIHNAQESATHSTIIIPSQQQGFLETLLHIWRFLNATPSQIRPGSRTHLTMIDTWWDCRWNNALASYFHCWPHSSMSSPFGSPYIAMKQDNNEFLEQDGVFTTLLPIYGSSFTHIIRISRIWLFHEPAYM